MGLSLLSEGRDRGLERGRIWEMCGNEKIRYVHIMTHPEFPGELRVGCICACHMTDDYENPEARERDLKNRVQRKKNFMKKSLKNE